jgi:hypothetical protein
MANSSYLSYLPPVLWVPDNDPPQVLGRHLRVYEKILTGVAANGLVVRASALFLTAINAGITLVQEADVALFHVGDWVTIQGTLERRQITAFVGATLVLDANLIAAHPPGTVRIANLEPGQTSFRIDSAEQLEAGRSLRLRQAGQNEDLLIAEVDAPFVTLAFGLTQTFSLDLAFVPVKVIDPIGVDHSGHSHEDFERQIDQLFTLFNPWRTRRDLLPWLASWVALELRPEWSEYQQRLLISQMVGIYQRRGLKEGLFTYLDIYAVTTTRPRIVIDDGEALFHPVFNDRDGAVLRAVAHSNTVSPISDPLRTLTALLHPSGLAVDSLNQIFVCDPGDITLTVPRRPSLWKLSPNGDVSFATVAGLQMPMPQPIFSGQNPAPPGQKLVEPRAVTVDTLDRCAVVDIGTITSGNSKHASIFRFAPPAYAITTVIDQTTAPTFPAVHPVDMILDGAGNFIVLDRGRHPLGSPPAGPSAPQIVVVSEGPLAAVPHPLPTVKEPTVLIMDPLGRFILADARDQSTTTPADLVRVDPAAGFAATSLLGGMAPGTNPLIFPTGLAWESPGVLLVADVGLRWGFVVDPSNRTMAEAPALFRVDLNQVPPAIQPVTSQRQLVHPTKLAWDRNRRLLITDRGEAMDDVPQRNWRAGSNEFGVAVFFSNQRPTTPAERNKFRRGIVQVIDPEKPGHTSWWMDF